MVRTYLVRGLLVGLLAGLLATGFAKLAGEPQIAAAEKFEYAEATARGEPPEKELVSRDVQDTLGLTTGVLVAGAALGGIYALAFAFVYGRLARTRARVTAALLAASAFVTIFLVPFLKYPANPPSVGSPDTIGHRTTLYFVMILLSLLAAVIAVNVYRRSVNRLGSWNSGLVAAALFIALVFIDYLVMPGINEVPPGFPATVLWRFRVASIGTQVVLWTALGLGFGALTERREAAVAADRVLAASSVQ